MCFYPKPSEEATLASKEVSSVSQITGKDRFSAEDKDRCVDLTPYKHKTFYIHSLYTLNPKTLNPIPKPLNPKPKTPKP